MREIDFLPDWYPAIQRRRRLVIAQAWASLGIVLIMLICVAVKRWQLGSLRKTTALCEAQITLSQQQLDQLAKKVEYESQLRRENEIVSRLGTGVETTRLLSLLENAMTPEMAVTAISLETVQQVRATPVSFLTRPSGAQSPPQTDRKLRFTVDGVAPNDIDAATMLARLNQMKFLDHAGFAYLREGKARDGHLIREFEVTFELILPGAGQ